MSQALSRPVPAVADVLIIGGGAAGGVAALELRRQGLSVVALEQGEWHDRADFPGDKWNWELAMTKAWSPQPEARGEPGCGRTVDSGPTHTSLFTDCQQTDCALATLGLVAFLTAPRACCNAYTRYSDTAYTQLLRFDIRT